MVAFKFHMDRLFGEASTRKTNAAGYLIRIRESTPQLEPGGETEKKGDIPEHEYGFWSSTIPARGRLDLVRIGKFFVHRIWTSCEIYTAPQDIPLFFRAWMSGGRGITSGSSGPPTSPRQLRGPRQTPTLPADIELWRCGLQGGRLHPSVPAPISHIFIFFSRQYPTLRHAAPLVT